MVDLEQAAVIVGFVGRLCLTNTFVWSAAMKTANFAAAIEEMKGYGLPFPGLFALAAIIIQAVGSVLLVLPQYAGVGAAVLALFTLVASLIAHMPWSAGPKVAPVPHFILGMLNLGQIGGLLVIVSFALGARL